jgi:hypothetical protein
MRSCTAVTPPPLFRRRGVRLSGMRHALTACPHGMPSFGGVSCGLLRRDQYVRYLVLCPTPYSEVGSEVVPAPATGCSVPSEELRLHHTRRIMMRLWSHSPGGCVRLLNLHAHLYAMPVHRVFDRTAVVNSRIGEVAALRLTELCVATAACEHIGKGRPAGAR